MEMLELEVVELESGLYKKATCKWKRLELEAVCIGKWQLEVATGPHKVSSHQMLR